MNLIPALDLFPLLASVLVLVGCTLLGNFLVLRRQSLMGDALSHTVLPGVVGAQVFVSHPTDQTLNIPEKQKRAYDPAVAAELYQVNCAACHGTGGQGDGPITPFLTSAELTRDGNAYPAPPNLMDSRDVRVEDVVFSLMSNGINVMPRFDLLLTEEERWDLVAYIFDTENGLGR